MFDEHSAPVITERLALTDLLDSAVELSFLESARFRLELFDILRRLELRHLNATEALVALSDLHGRVATTIQHGAGAISRS